MKRVKNLKRPLLSFVLLSNVIFWVILAITGFCLSLGASQIVIKFAQVIGAWSSTFAFLILYKHLVPDMSLTDYIKKQFKNKINILSLIGVIILPFILFVINLYTLKSPLIYSNGGLLIGWFLFNIISGPTGEELGWRGFMLNKLQDKHSPFTSSLIIGLVWGIWHAPIWLISGFTGEYLIKYVVLFMITFISFTIVVTFFYNFSRNLLIPIILHLLFNFTSSLISTDPLNIFINLAVGYSVIAMLILVIKPKLMFYVKQNEGYQEYKKRIEA